MVMAIGNKCKVYLETPQGAMIEVPAISYSLSYRSPWGDGPTEVEMSFKALGDVTWLDQAAWEKTVEERHSAKEWKCDYCGRPNDRKDETCKSCGAVRSFVYG